MTSKTLSKFVYKRAGDRRLTGQDVVVLKGGRDGVAVIIDEGASIEAAVQELREKLTNAGNFFRGAAFRLESGERILTEDERSVLSSAMEEFGIYLRETDGSRNVGGRRMEPLGNSGMQSSEPAPGRSGIGESPENTLLVRRTLRSGQRVDYNGNVVVMGDVNAGAVVMCAGDIVVLGSLRGLAHAGAEGAVNAVVMAFRLQPTQLRIANYISRAPDEAGPRPEGPEVARVRNDVIQIEAYVP